MFLFIFLGEQVSKSLRSGEPLGLSRDIAILKSTDLVGSLSNDEQKEDINTYIYILNFYTTCLNSNCH